MHFFQGIFLSILDSMLDTQLRRSKRKSLAPVASVDYVWSSTPSKTMKTKFLITTKSGESITYTHEQPDTHKRSKQRLKIQNNGEPRETQNNDEGNELKSNNKRSKSSTNMTHASTPDTPLSLSTKQYLSLNETR